MIHPHSRADCPVAAMPLVLHKSRLLAPAAPVQEMEGRGNVVIENGYVAEIVCGDDIAEVFVNGVEQSVGTGLELVRAQLDGQAPAKITFAETALLHGQNRRRQLVRPQLRRRVPQHPAYLEHDVRREQVSVRY